MGRHMGRRFTIAALCLVAGLFLVFSMPLFAKTAPLGNSESIALAAAYTLTPAADAYVNSAYPSTNYGTLTQLRIDGSPVTNSYIRFGVSGLSGTVSKATLRIYANTSLNVGYVVHGVISNTWGETTVTYGNAPAMGATLGQSAAVVTGTWTAVDVTSFVKGNGTYSFGITDPSSTALSLASRESAYPPQLVISTSATPTPTKVAAATPTASGTVAPTKTPTPTATPATDPVIAAAGDIACSPTSSSFNGGAGTANACREQYTSNLLLNINPVVVLPLGDTQYYDGAYNDFMKSYDPSWGRIKSISRPAVGNHEYLTSGATGYYSYFGSLAGDPKKGYYSYNIGAWHLIALNSQCSNIGGCGSGSPEETWLKNDLAAHPAKCTLAYWHIPLWSSGGRANSVTRTLMQDLYNAHAEVVLTGHDHDYERFAPMSPSGALDSVNGVREFVVGTGGADHTSFTTTAANSQVRNDTTFGVLKLTLHATSYDWKFVPDTGTGTFTDSGSQACH